MNIKLYLERIKYEGPINTTFEVLKKKNTEGKFIPEYLFSEKERHIEEFYSMCYYHQTSNESHFTEKRICSLPTQNGRKTLTGNTLKTVSYTHLTLPTNR